MHAVPTSKISTVMCRVHMPVRVHVSVCPFVPVRDPQLHTKTHT
jgi:hypothetical protein